MLVRRAEFIALSTSQRAPGFSQLFRVAGREAAHYWTADTGAMVRKEDLLDHLGMEQRLAAWIPGHAGSGRTVRAAHGGCRVGVAAPSQAPSGGRLWGISPSQVTTFVVPEKDCPAGEFAFAMTVTAGRVCWRVGLVEPLLAAVTT